ncbi:MAG: cupin domain-containing protein [Bacteroidota bacterium]
MAASYDAAHWIGALGLQPHPEGGHFAETYRAAESIPAAALPERYRGVRSFCTQIYFLLEHASFSAFHRLTSDEAWHFYHGSPVDLHLIHPDGRSEQRRLGEGAFQTVVPAGAWFGATVHQPGSYTLVGCTVAPGFDFADFELADRATLQARFPQHAALIARLTR